MRSLLAKFNLSEGGLDDVTWDDLVNPDESGMPKVIKWVHDWCRGNDRLNTIEEFLCILLEDEVIKSNRLVHVGVDAVAQLLHLRIHCGTMITRRFDHLNYEVGYCAYMILRIGPLR